MNTDNAKEYRSSGKYLTEKPDDYQKLFFYKGLVVKIKRKIGDDQYQVRDPLTSFHLATVHYTKLELPVLSKTTDYIIDDIREMISIIESITTDSPAIPLLNKVSKIIRELDK